MTITIFLSYAHEDINAAQDIYRVLQEKGFLPWLDEFDLLPGQEWQETIVQQIQTIDIVLICLSHNSVDKRGFFQKEIKIALDVCDQMPEGDIFLIPVRLDNIDIPERLRKFQWVDLFEQDGFDKLITSLFYQQDKLNRLKQQQRPSILLDFKSITNPVTLLQCLVIFRNTHQSIIVGEHNINAIEWLDEPGGPTPMSVNLLDDGYLKHLESYHGYLYDDLEFSKTNYLLALRILKFAIDEQFIKIERTSDSPLLNKLETFSFNFRGSNDAFHRIAEQLADTLHFFDNEIDNNSQLKALKSKIRAVVSMKAGKSSSKAWDGGFLLTPCYVSADWYSDFKDYIDDPYASNQRYDLSLSLKKNYHMAIDGDLSSFPTNSSFEEMINLHSSLYQETITSITPHTFYDYQKIIEIARLFSEISNEIINDIPQMNSVKQFHWFNPWLNQISSNKTSPSSLAKVLYSTIKRVIKTNGV